MGAYTRSGHRWPYRGYPGFVIAPPYGYGFGYGGFLGPNFVGYPFGFDVGYDEDESDPSASQQENYPQDEQAAESYAPPATVQVAEGQGSDVYRPAYDGSSQGSSGMEQPVRPQPATTLVFNDGRPNLQIHNYVLTKTTLYDLDGGKPRVIPLLEINLSASVKANRSAGVDFAPPSTRP